VCSGDHTDGTPDFLHYSNPPDCHLADTTLFSFAFYAFLFFSHHPNITCFLKPTMLAELERNQLYKLAIKDQLAIRVVQQAFAFVLMYQHPRLEPLLRAMPTELCRTLCSLAIPFLACGM
jgi:hypothetical protein